MLLQNNLKTFLKRSDEQQTTIQLYGLLHDRINYMRNLYPHITFEISGDKRAQVETAKESLIRIVDNLLDNAAKYNRKAGSVHVTVDPHRIRITDNGLGIKNPQAVFERYYKEQSRGVGLGLHIVKKLCDTLGITIDIESQVDVGTTVTLRFADQKRTA